VAGSSVIAGGDVEFMSVSTSIGEDWKGSSTITAARPRNMGDLRNGGYKVMENGNRATIAEPTSRREKVRSESKSNRARMSTRMRRSLAASIGATKERVRAIVPVATRVPGSGIASVKVAIFTKITAWSKCPRSIENVPSVSMATALTMAREVGRVNHEGVPAQGGWHHRRN